MKIVDVPEIEDNIEEELEDDEISPREAAFEHGEEDNEEEDIVAIDDVEDNIEIKLTNGNGSMSSAAMQIGKYLVPRENCNKIIKVSENTVKRIKDLKKDKYEAIGDVVRRLCEGAKK